MIFIKYFKFYNFFKFYNKINNYILNLLNNKIIILYFNILFNINKTKTFENLYKI